MIDTYYVIAGNHSEYLDFIGKKFVENPWQNFIEVNTHTFNGVINPRGFLIGTWKQRKDIKDLLLRLMTTYTPNIGVPPSIIESYGLVSEL